MMFNSIENYYQTGTNGAARWLLVLMLIIFLTSGDDIIDGGAGDDYFME